MSKFISNKIPDNSEESIKRTAELLNRKPARQGSNQQGIEVKQPEQKQKK